ncbi:hypothetical protein KMZ15_00825 [Mycoavidus sp. HKI]|uniref:hypothetical protein n=1 Tax=Mycoavidus sp. HKI TaxID=2840467 RepID=UPI001CC06F75|nr:hypothetical protein [Mycoavidus sp. HKI]UAW64277.1 hypothetical protein KMZ15_00825 [Mycoavidus sp. HKI]
MISSDLPLRSNAWNAVNESRMLRLTTQGIYSDEYKNPFELVRVALNTLRDGQYAVVQRLKENLAATAETEVISQQIKMQLSQAEKALANYEDELKKVAQLSHQLITRILDAIR